MGLFLSLVVKRFPQLQFSCLPFAAPTTTPAPPLAMLACFTPSTGFQPQIVLSCSKAGWLWGGGAFPARPVAAGGWEASHEQTPQGAGPVRQGHPSPSPAHIQHSHKVFCWVAEGEKKIKKNGSNHNKLRMTALNCEE